VPEKTLRTAMDYVALLWGERVNEKLVKTDQPAERSRSALRQRSAASTRTSSSSTSTA
jgi:hypothetical protein